MHSMLFQSTREENSPISVTILCFNPLSLSPDELSALPDIQVCVGGSVIFQTKKAVLDNVSPSFFYAQHSFESHTRRGQSIIAAPMKIMIIENSEGLEFFPVLFDYLRRKYDQDHNADENGDKENAAKAGMPYTRHLSPAQLHYFQQVCECLVPGIFHNNCLIIMRPLGFLDMT